MGFEPRTLKGGGSRLIKELYSFGLIPNWGSTRLGSLSWLLHGLGPSQFSTEESSSSADGENAALGHVWRYIGISHHQVSVEVDGNCDNLFTVGGRGKHPKHV